MGTRMTMHERIERIAGTPVRDVRIQRGAFADFKRLYGAYDRRPGVDDEKLLEYYISYTWLQLSQEDVFIDIAAQDCPFALFVADRVGCRAYRQDLYYLATDTRVGDIGGDASHLPFADASVSKMALHNSFEHFEADSDMGFMREAQRVLRPGGRICIVPFFFGETYDVELNAGWVDEMGAKHLWGIGARFARQYDLATLRSRVLDSAPGLIPTMHYVVDVEEVAADYWVDWFLILQKT